MKKYKSYTFFSFAAQIIQNNILDSIKTDSHIVRIPISQQNKERKDDSEKARFAIPKKHSFHKDGEKGGNAGANGANA